MVKFDERKTVAGSLIILWLLFLILVAFAGSAGVADNFVHFNIAGLAFPYPHLLSDHWGKPGFAILIALFVYGLGSNHYFRMGPEIDFNPCVLLTNQGEMAFSIEKNNPLYTCQGDDIQLFAIHSERWTQARFGFAMPKDLKTNSQIKFYFVDIQEDKLKTVNLSVQEFRVRKTDFSVEYPDL